MYTKALIHGVCLHPVYTVTDTSTVYICTICVHMYRILTATAPSETKLLRQYGRVCVLQIASLNEHTQ